jgi:hypothetical protein
MRDGIGCDGESSSALQDVGGHLVRQRMDSLCLRFSGTCDQRLFQHGQVFLRADLHAQRYRFGVKVGMTVEAEDEERGAQ